MPSNSLTNRILPLLGHALLLGCAIAALWVAVAVVVPSAQIMMRPYSIGFPEYFRFAFTISDACLESVCPLAITGIVLLLVALVGKGPARLLSACRVVLAMLAGAVSILSAYLLCSGGLGMKVANTAELGRIHAYEITLNHFVLLEATQGRYEKVLADFKTLQVQGAKMVEAHSASEFDDEDARIRIGAIISLLSTTSDPAGKKQLLASLSLFRDRVPASKGEDVLRFAVEAGAPPAKSYAVALDWIAANLNKDGWEPFPLFKISQ